MAKEWDMEMELKFAGDVQVIVEEGSISDAARRLNISQPALSARVKKLEDSYGIRVFKRNRRPVTLTDEGRRYLEYATKVQDMDKEFRRTVAQTKELLSGEERMETGELSGRIGRGKNTTRHAELFCLSGDT